MHSPGQEKSDYDLLNARELTTVYEVHDMLLKLRLRVHPKDILFFVMHSKTTRDSNKDFSLNLSEVVGILKSSIYSLVKEDLGLFEFTAVAFAVLNFIAITLIQKTFANQFIFFFDSEIIFLTLVVLSTLISFIALRRVLFKWTRVEFPNEIERQVKKVISPTL